MLISVYIASLTFYILVLAVSIATYGRVICKVSVVYVTK
jgi:hypothetical protein